MAEPPPSYRRLGRKMGFGGVTMCIRVRRLFTMIFVALLMGALTVFPSSPAVNAQPNIVEPTFVSPNYNYSIRWESPWFVVEKDVEDGFEHVSVHDGLSQVSFLASRVEGFDAPTIRDELADVYRNDPGVTAFAAMVDANGAPMTENSPNHAYTFYAYTLLQGANSIAMSMYVETRILPDETELVIVAVVESAEFAIYSGLWPQIYSWVETSGKPNSGSDPGTNGDLDGNAVEFIIDPAVSDEDLVAITEGVRLAQGFVVSELGVSIDDVLYVTAFPIASPGNPTLAGSSVGSGIVLYTGYAAWAESVTPLERIGVVVHEYIHAYQQWISNGESIRSAAWFEEGLAEYLSVSAMAQLRISDSSDFDALFDHLLWISTPPVSLAQLESPIEFYAHGAGVYPLSYFAVARLLAYTGANYTNIDTYYLNLGDGLSFEDAFQAEFGISTLQYYEEFERVRGTLGSLQLPPDDFIILEGTRTPSPVSLSIAPTLLVRDHQFLFLADTAPGTVCRLRIILDEADASLVNRSTFANGSGELFWLVTIPADISPSAGTLTVTCGKLRDQADILIAR